MLSSRVAKNGAIAAAVWLSSVTISCDVNPYQSLKDETVGLGAVDPVNFPPDNLGADGNRMQPGSGSFTEIAAFAGGADVGYFAFPVKTSATRDPLRVLDAGKPYPGVSTPTAYVFDATDTTPIPDKNRCTPPDGYDPTDPGNARRDPTQTWYLQQNNIFTDLPKASYTPGVDAASSYVPVVQEARISSKGRTCQELKSEKLLSDQLSGKPPKPGTNYLAWLIIDPAAAVYGADGMPASGVGLQKWGWFNRYLLAYLDGGYIPTADAMVSGGTMDMPTMKVVKRMVTQKLYVPLQVLDKDTMMPADGAPGQGYDVLAAKRGADGYSPVCEVVTYDTKMPLAPGDLPKDAAVIEMMFGPTKPATPHYIYCLQVR
jgi:hypothetical protein